jgi:hypothetical protein
VLGRQFQVDGGPFDRGIRREPVLKTRKPFGQRVKKSFGWVRWFTGDRVRTLVAVGGFLFAALTYFTKG